MSCATSSAPSSECESNEFRNNICKDSNYYNGQRRIYETRDLNRDRFYLARPR
jgi:hypothetical protein